MYAQPQYLVLGGQSGYSHGMQGQPVQGVYPQPGGVPQGSPLQPPLGQPQVPQPQQPPGQTGGDQRGQPHQYQQAPQLHGSAPQTPLTPASGGMDGSWSQPRLGQQAPPQESQGYPAYAPMMSMAQQNASNGQQMNMQPGMPQQHMMHNAPQMQGAPILSQQLPPPPPPPQHQHHQHQHQQPMHLPQQQPPQQMQHQQQHQQQQQPQQQPPYQYAPMPPVQMPGQGPPQHQQPQQLQPQQQQQQQQPQQPQQQQQQHQQVHHQPQAASPPQQLPQQPVALPSPPTVTMNHPYGPVPTSEPMPVPVQEHAQVPAPAPAVQEPPRRAPVARIDQSALNADLMKDEARRQAAQGSSSPKTPDEAGLPARRKVIGDEDLPLLVTTDKPSCTHNRWILSMKRKRFYIMECMVCRTLWKTKLKSTQKCDAFFAGNCPLDHTCPHPHVYSRSRLKAEALIMPNGDAAKALASLSDTQGDDQGLFVPVNLDSAEAQAKTDKNELLRGLSRHTANANASSTRSLYAPKQLLSDLEQSRRLVVALEWWQGFVATVLNRPKGCTAPDGFHVQPGWLERLLFVIDTNESVRRSLRLRWVDRPINTELSWMSTFTEPPELLDGGYYLLAAACLTVETESLLSITDQEIGHGSFGAVYAGAVKDWEELARVCDQTADGTGEWLLEKRPQIGIQVIELQEVDEAAEDRILSEIECLSDCTSDYIMRMIATFGVGPKRDRLWVVAEACLSAEQLQNDKQVRRLADMLTQKADDGSKKDLPLDTVKKMLRCCFTGLAHLHSRSWIHLTIHPRNIVYDSERDVFVLTGFKKVLKCSTSTTISPPPTYPPNQFIYTPAEHHGGASGAGYCSGKSDVYALGMCGVFAARMTPDQIRDAKGENDHPLYEFLRGCIEPSQQARFSAEAAASHPFLKGE
eukprot:TRINITY_DN3661_c1_g1_i1.p1 TRINITY_DN3661_c1_g1~~TRINITY_DN3661_c1_g1_i1.p1  ORF type:complete len:916 (+),score=236.96 TRINITY_DN3661_c1_g1_i1:97-2844(+)